MGYLLRDPRDLRRYAPSTPPRQSRWASSVRRQDIACALRPWHPSPARTSLQRVPLLLDPAFALHRAPRRAWAGGTGQARRRRPDTPAVPAKAESRVLQFPSPPRKRGSRF